MASVSRKDCKIPSNAPKELLLPQHSDFIKKYGDEKEEYDYVMSEFLRINGIYWCLTAMDLMKSRDLLDRDEIMSYVHSCYDASTGGFTPAPRHDPHILNTLSAVQIAATYDALGELDSEAIVKYVCSLQRPEDGSFTGDKWGEVDTRFSFCAVATLKLLGRLDACDVDKAVEFVASCKNFDGGFGSRPGSESHAGLIYCAVGFLSVTQRLDVLDPDLLGWWLCERQLPSGGLNGRPEKLPGWGAISVATSMFYYQKQTRKEIWVKIATNLIKMKRRDDGGLTFSSVKHTIVGARKPYLHDS